MTEHWFWLLNNYKYDICTINIFFLRLKTGGELSGVAKTTAEEWSVKKGIVQGSIKHNLLTKTYRQTNVWAGVNTFSFPCNFNLLFIRPCRLSVCIRICESKVLFVFLSSRFKNMLKHYFLGALYIYIHTHKNNFFEWLRWILSSLNSFRFILSMYTC